MTLTNFAQDPKDVEPEIDMIMAASLEVRHMPNVITLNP